MISNDLRQDFENWVECCNPPLSENPLQGIAALMTSAAFARPTLQIPIFDAINQAITAHSDPADQAAQIISLLPWAEKGLPRTVVPANLWSDFWKILDAPADDFDGALDLTLRVVALGTKYDARMIDECEEALMQFDSVKSLIAQPEIRLKTSDLENHPEDSLATELLNMLTANGYDIEVIDADTVLLDSSYPAQNRTNRRILQLHDIWHLVGGYGFTSGGEVAISGFQLAQFGQNYSTRFLATVGAKSVFLAPQFAPLLLNVMFDGWKHGRAAVPLLDAPWHQLIADPISQIRSRYGLEPLHSPSVQLMDSLVPIPA